MTKQRSTAEGAVAGRETQARECLLEGGEPFLHKETKAHALKYRYKSAKGNERAAFDAYLL